MTLAIDSHPNTDLGSLMPEWLKGCWQKIAAAEPIDPEDPEAIICRALKFACELHEGQYRASGEPYILHPIEVATILRDLGGGSKAMIVAGFLHDVVEDTEVTVADIEAEFGAEIAALVEGVTKLSKFNFESKTERAAENFRRMFLAMAQDIRVIVVKLADRLHNMRTLEHLPAPKQANIARETMEIFAPLANRLGIGQIKWELEDLSFKYIDKDAYQQMRSLVVENRRNREERLARVRDILRSRIEQLGLTNFEISGRPKHLYGIYQKMQVRQKKYEEIYDVSAIRIIVENKEACYRVLAVVHDCFRPIPGRFKDYIGLPKPNRYQSLHTVVIGPNGRPLEVQIRTWEMHHIAEYGIAAHWKYKETNSSHQATSQEDEKFTWLRQLVEWQRELKDDQEYIDTLKENLFDHEVYVFSPKGDVYCLPRGATAVDFAYRIHTELGNHCAGALVNEFMVPLDRKLQNGDIVTVLRHKNAHPSLDWINFVATSSARHRIRQWYKRSRREENYGRGRSMLEREMGKGGLDSLLKSERMLEVARRCNYHSVDDMLAALGYGEISLNMVVNKLREEQTTQEAAIAIPRLPSAPSANAASPTKSPILGLEGLPYRIAGCCQPLPGEPIIGVVPRGGNRSIAVHKQECENIADFPGDRLIPISWNNRDDVDRPSIYTVDIRVETIDRVGVLKDILARLADEKVNVRHATVDTRPGDTATIELSIDINSRNQYEKLHYKISNMSDIVAVRRINRNDS
ncbi:(p)ppGpp synthetase I, SpoT/RelA [Thalassoporum mexicanum PCC 7367]|uniref:RelA/SpoT family protein n=1 Tax=Thalassoporum mexicanum TaxID=3457544 RepID=UPI00029FD6CF|nr:bifunctional (p)ppGpp synthetase/guanosine-3',5'-bis(diphosphate) 3'-pyrophosphohydrolase [Pseudanabaena sp. PCC 7367]AFY71768.1 (p)ppGpp synthetase I, SpoT/RelA [Pseudanabaena sp. PCC 7367]